MNKPYSLAPSSVNLQEYLGKCIPHALLKHADMKTLVEAAGLTCFPSSLVYFTVIGSRTRIFDVTLKVHIKPMID